MKTIIKMFAIGICLLAATINVSAQEFDVTSISEMSKAQLQASAQDGNKQQTVAFQKSNGDEGAFDCDGLYIGLAGGYRSIDNGSAKPYAGVSFIWESIPTYRLGYKQMLDGRIANDWRHMFSIELQFHIGNREYIEDADSSGDYLSYGGIAYLKYRIPGFDNWTMYRFQINLMAGVGASYGRYDKTVENVYVFNNAFGVYYQAMVELRFRPSKSLASALFIRGGISGLPGYALNEVWTARRLVAEGGFSIALHPNHRVTRVND